MIILLDNGSTRPEATRNLRRLAAALSARTGRTIHPVSLLHASRIDPADLDGVRADILEPFLLHQCEQGQRDFTILPLFFGPSRALEQFIPDLVERMAQQIGPLRVKVADVLCPLPAGEPGLVDILADHVTATVARHGLQAPRVVLVDHGSPVPAVTAVRHWLAARLAERLHGVQGVSEAVMERRPGAEYDFNGALLADWLAQIGSGSPVTEVVLAMQFISPGRHAGVGGDIESISQEAMAQQPGLRVLPSPLLGEHPRLLDILTQRLVTVDA
ncbi:cobalamin biosynthesis protein CbiX [Thiohalocapsa marina]|uniref:Cobalamin biosynthesis protein CbiX n=1 Tax=Thiohalocapsa marina TaxID=424902 RepID=A0A5M8FRZ1_9GAMM|nr:cobalamin biosynthesis protein CbiX [Thiohalocapsa marina]KAA6186611.1 cobalamin biosynthesis protein CbiX [Thiohalocapsa marina]